MGLQHYAGGSVVMIAACSDEGTAGDTNMHNGASTLAARAAAPTSC